MDIIHGCSFSTKAQNHFGLTGKLTTSVQGRMEIKPNAVFQHRNCKVAIKLGSRHNCNVVPNPCQPEMGGAGEA